MLTFHTDVVGSLLRPPELLKAQEAFEERRIPATELKTIEDKAVDDAVALQEEAGLDVVTDGEMRRLSFQSQMLEAVEGFGQWNIDAFLWGDWHGDDSVGNLEVERPANLGVVSKLRRKRFLSVDEFTYLNARTTKIAKITLPSPSLFSNFWNPDRSAAAYPTLDAFLADVVDILRGEVAELVRLGARYIQLDAPHYPLLLEPTTRAFYESRGWSLAGWLEHGIAMDNAVIEGFPDVTFGFHL